MNTKTLLSVLALVVVVLAGGAFIGSKNNSDQAAAVAQQPSQSAVVEPTTVPTTPASETSGTVSYKDGSYTANGEYMAPSGLEDVTLTVTLKNDVIVDSTFVAFGKNPASKQNQADFIAHYKTYVTGKNISEVKLDKVSGSSLTSTGFNSALEAVKTQAKA